MPPMHTIFHAGSRLPNTPIFSDLYIETLHRITTSHDDISCFTNGILSAPLISHLLVCVIMKDTVA